MYAERYIARQPIFSRQLEVVAYELLFRSDLDNYCKTDNTALASSTVLDHSLLLFDLARLADGKTAFINISHEGLLAEHPRLLPQEHTMIELVESIGPDPAVIALCRELVADGYSLALDDFVEKPGMQSLVDLASCVKIDIRATRAAELAGVVGRLRRPGLRLLAEKVETREDFERVRHLDFDLFQGYFFAEPVILSSADIPGFKLTYLQLLRDINQEPYDINRIELLLMQDPSICFKFLRYVNSAAVALRHRVASIRETLVLLGVRKIRALASMWVLAELGHDQPEALLTTSVARARFCGGLATLSGLASRESEAFLMGLLSLIDAIVGRPIEALVATLPVTDDVRLALTDRRGVLFPLLDCAMAYERGEWERVTALVEDLGASHALVSEAYLQAIGPWGGGAR